MTGVWRLNSKNRKYVRSLLILRLCLGLTCCGHTSKQVMGLDLFVSTQVDICNDPRTACGGHTCQSLATHRPRTEHKQTTKLLFSLTSICNDATHIVHVGTRLLGSNKSTCNAIESWIDFEHVHNFSASDFTLEDYQR